MTRRQIREGIPPDMTRDMTPDMSGDRPIMPLDAQPDPNDAAVSLLRKILADAFWHIAYHEAELPNAHRKAAVVSAFLERAGMPIDLKDARKVYDAMEDPDEPRDVHEFAAALLVEAENGIEHHETNLAEKPHHAGPRQSPHAARQVQPLARRHRGHSPRQAQSCRLTLIPPQA